MGLVARFLYCTPPSKMGNRNYDSKSVNRDTLNTYSDKIQSLVKIPYAKTEEELKTLTLSIEAQEVCRKTFYEIEKQLPNTLDFMKDWAGKLHGQIVRIASLLHFAENIEGIFSDVPFYLEVSKDTYQRAMVLGKYYLQHALNILGSCSANEETANALYLVDKLKKKALQEITQRDLHQIVKGKLSKEELENTLKLLEENNYVRIKAVGKSNHISINPQFIENIENVENIL